MTYDETLEAIRRLNVISSLENDYNNYGSKRNKNELTEPLR
jgi:hypothetical protein